MFVCVKHLSFKSFVYEWQLVCTICNLFICADLDLRYEPSIITRKYANFAYLVLMCHQQQSSIITR
jgi:hypothetical protein